MSESSPEIPTGDERVDAVLDEVALLGERPVEEHPAVYERAHEELRAALDRAAAEGAPDPGAGSAAEPPGS